MAQIKHSEIISTTPKLTNIFDVPFGLDGFDIVPLEKDELVDSAPGIIGENDAAESVLQEGAATLDADIIGKASNAHGLQPPSNILVEGERVSFGPDKTHVIDVTVGFLDSPGATSYEVRISKV